MKLAAMSVCLDEKESPHDRRLCSFISALILLFPSNPSVDLDTLNDISMLFSGFWTISLASLALASPFHNRLAGRADLAALCGYPNGNCYENGCEGDRSVDGMTCTAV